MLPYASLHVLVQNVLSALERRQRRLVTSHEPRQFLYRRARLDSGNLHAFAQILARAYCRARDASSRAQRTTEEPPSVRASSRTSVHACQMGAYARSSEFGIKMRTSLHTLACTVESTTLMSLATEDDVWFLLRSYYRTYGMCRHQIESFNNFLQVLLPHIVQESSEIRVCQDDEEHVVSMCNLSVERPTVSDADGTERALHPHMARLRNLTYSSPILVDVVHDIYRDGRRLERRVFPRRCVFVDSRSCSGATRATRSTRRVNSSVASTRADTSSCPGARRWSSPRRSCTRTFRTCST